MSSPSNWFVQTGFGAVLGPMPTDALTEMIRTSALIATDLVRNESSAEWEPAGSVPGLFSSSPSELKPLSAAHTNPVTATKSSPESHSQQRPDAEHTPSLPTTKRPIVPTETVAYAFNKPTVPEPAQELDLVAKWKAERQQRPKRREENRANDPLSDHIERDINEAELVKLLRVRSEDA